MDLLDNEIKARQEIFGYFGYAEDWRILPFDDAREYYWRIEGGDMGTVCFAETKLDLARADGEYYENDIYTQRHLRKWVYRGSEYTMIMVDTHVDGNQLLQIFDNAKELP